MGLKRALIRILGGVSPQEDAPELHAEAEQLTVEQAIVELQGDVAHLFKMLKKLNSRAAAEARWSGGDTPPEGENVDPEGSQAASRSLPGSILSRSALKADLARRFASQNGRRP